MSVSFDTGSYADVLLEARNPLQIPVLVKVTILFLRYKREKFPSSEIFPPLSYTFQPPTLYILLRVHLTLRKRM